MNKKILKKTAKKCYVCDESNYNLLDVHRIQWGKSYSKSNTVVLCVNCHRKVHCLPPEIVIFGWLNSTKGKVLHYINEQGEEQFR